MRLRLMAVLLVLLLAAPTALGAWTRSEARLPQPPTGAAVVAANGMVYLFGGEGPDGNATATVVRYDPATRSVEVLPATLPAPRQDMSAVWDGERIQLLGGRDADGDLTRQVWRFDPASERFVDSLALLPEARAGMAAVRVADAVLVIGGAPCDPCHVLRLEGDRFADTNATLPGSLTDAAAYWDGHAVHVLAGFLDGVPHSGSWALDASGLKAGPVMPHAGRAQATYDGLHGLVRFDADPFVVWRVDDMARLGPAADVPAPASHMVGAAPVVLLGAGVGAAADHVGILHFDPAQAYILADNPWCGPLGRDPCDARAPGAGTPWLPFLGGVLLFLYIGAAAMMLRGRIAPGRLPERERDRWIALPAIAVIGLLVLAWRPWAHIALGDAVARAAPFLLQAPLADSWIGIPRGGLVLAGAVAWGAGVVLAAVATFLFGMRRRAIMWAFVAALALASGWTLVATGVHVASDGAYLRWRAPVLLAFGAVVSFVMGAFLLLRGPAVGEDTPSHARRPTAPSGHGIESPGDTRPRP